MAKKRQSWIWLAFGTAGLAGLALWRPRTRPSPIPPNPYVDEPAQPTGPTLGDLANRYSVPAAEAAELAANAVMDRFNEEHPNLTDSEYATIEDQLQSEIDAQSDAAALQRVAALLREDGKTPEWLAAQIRRLAPANYGNQSLYQLAVSLTTRGTGPLTA